MYNAKVTFGDKLQFSAKKSLESLKLPAICSTIPTGKREEIKSQSLVQRSVIYQPRYHQSELTDKGFVFRGRSSELAMKRIILETEQRNNEECKTKELENILHTLRQKDGKTGRTIGSRTTFRRHFKPLGSNGSDLIQMAKFRLSFCNKPYNNPMPYQHREIDCCYGDSRFITCKTPDPANIRFKTKSVKDQILDSNVCHSDKIEQTAIDDLQFVTYKTPEPKYIPYLYFHKGRYSPAFTAHDAFMDRIAKSISQ